MAEGAGTALPPLREVIALYDLAARKALGQNFLLDLNITRRIVRAARLPPGATAIEVGPGPGGLTRALMEAPEPARIVALEKDPRCVRALTELLQPVDPRLSVRQADALEIPVAELGPAPRVIIANLPYNISTVLLLQWLRDLSALHSLTLMFQREVADRLTAPPGGKAYGRLSVITQWLCTPTVQFTLPARAFTPPPKIDSSVVHLIPRAAPDPAPFAAVEAVTAAAFGQRRKMLRQSLKSLGVPDVEGLIAEAGLDPQQRAETVPVAGFCALARVLTAWRADP